MPVWGLDLAAGFSLGFGLILAIGAQNAFVLRQGLRREHVGAVVAACALSDAALIAAGVAGFGILVERAAWIAPLFRYGAAAFLVFCGTIVVNFPDRGEDYPIGTITLTQNKGTPLTITTNLQRLENSAEGNKWHGERRPP